MKIGWIVLALVGTNPNATAVEVTAQVTTDGAASPYAAKRLASSILLQAGVTIAWQSPKPPASGARRACLHIDLVGWSPKGRHPGALAVAYPFAGCSKSITVFVDRIRAVARGVDRESALLAYVLVHEITHVIQGVDRHSEAGIMKASWSADDREAIFERRLGFLEDDVRLMDREPAAGARARPPALTDRSGSRTASRPE